MRKFTENLYLFDVDGTLTPPRQKMTEDFYSFFKEWADSEKVYLISGSDYKKLKEQLPKNLLEAVEGVYGCMGNSLYVGGQNMYKNIFRPSDELLSFLKECVEGSSYKSKTGNHIEERVGMINFSIVGRNANLKQREEYFKFDCASFERKAIAKKINEKFDNIEASVGGEISIDIYPSRWDKSQIVKRLPKKTNFIFFGDRTKPGGNDFSLAAALLGAGHKVHAVKSFEETWKILEEGE
jgi:phosphomannomutase